MLNEHFNRIGMIARWKPLHVGQAAVLHELCMHAQNTLIGIGSSNRYNLRNPFNLTETEDMLHLALAGYDNYDLISVPDLDDGRRWREMILNLYGKLDCFVTDNPYVATLLKDDYRIIRPIELIPPEKQVRIDGATVRGMTARGEEWQAWVPEKIRAYIQQNGLDARFRNEFGLETLALQTIIQ